MPSQIEGTTIQAAVTLKTFGPATALTAAVLGWVQCDLAPQTGLTLLVSARNIPCERSLTMPDLEEFLADCPICDGTGYTIGFQWTRDKQEQRLGMRPCEACAGLGYALTAETNQKG